MDYIFTVRNIRKGRFGSEPGATHFLEIPEDTTSVTPARKIPKARWVRAVMEAAKRDGRPTGDILFFVHGFRNSQDDVLRTHRKIRTGLEALGWDGVVVSFDWPSASSALNYLEDRKDAKFTALRLVDEGISSFAALQRDDCRINLHVLAHSLGAYVLREAFDDADDRPAIAARSWSVSQLMLIAADVSVDSLRAGNPKSSSLYRHCVRLTHYYNRFDEILSLADVKRIGVAPRSGRAGLPPDIPAKAVDVYCGAYYQARRAGFADGPGASHSFYFEAPEFIEDMFHTIEGRIDRAEIPTRALASNGDLALRP